MASDYQLIGRRVEDPTTSTTGDTFLGVGGRRIEKAQNKGFPSIRRSPVSMTQAEKDLILHSLRGAAELSQWVIPQVNRDLYAELFRLKELLIWYDKNIPDKVYTTKEIILRCINDQGAFADELGDMTKYSLRRTLSIESVKENLLQYPEIKSLDDIFHFSCLLKFPNEDTQDYKLLQEAPPPFEINADEVFKILDSMPFKSEYSEPDILDLLDYVRDSSLFDLGTSKGKKCYKAFLEKEASYTDRFSFRRVFVYKRPGESRDALEADMDTLYTISTCDKIIGDIASTIPEYKLKANFDPQIDLDHLGWKNFYVMVDFKKCGLTFPRKFLLVLLEWFAKKIPHPSVINTLNAYKSNPSIYVPDTDEWIEMTNGVGLGQLNSLVTIATIVAYKYACGQNCFPDNVTGWFYNDDQMVYWEKSTILCRPPEEITEEYIYILRKFGLRVHEMKPFTSEFGQMCECFTHNLPFSSNKRLCIYNILLEAINAPTIGEAKARFAPHYMVWDGLTEEDNISALQSVTSFWGYEFSPLEIDCPYELGGWTFRIRDGLNDHLTMLLDPECPDFCKKFWNFYKEPKVPWRFFKNTRKKLHLLSHLKQMEIDSDDPTLLSWNDRLAAIVKTNEKRAFKYDQYKLEVLYKRAKARALTQKNPVPSRNLLIAEIAKRTYTNCRVPDDIIFLHAKERGSFPIDLFEEKHGRDLLRLWYSTFEDIPTRLKEQPVYSDLFYIFADIPKEDMRLLYPLVGDYIKLIPKLQRFGTKTWTIFLDIFRRDFIGFDLSVSPSEEFAFLRSMAIGKGDTVIPYDGMLVRIDLPDKDLDDDSFKEEFVKQLGFVDPGVHYLKAYEAIHQGYIDSTDSIFKERSNLRPVLFEKEVDVEHEPSTDPEATHAVLQDDPLPVFDEASWRYQIEGVYAHIGEEMTIRRLADQPQIVEETVQVAVPLEEVSASILDEGDVDLFDGFF